MRLAVAFLAVALAAPAPAAPSRRAPPPPAAVAAADAVAKAVGPPPEGRRSLRLASDAPAPALAQMLETALDAALSAQGYVVTPHRGPDDPEAAARSSGQDWLVRVRAGLVPGGADVAVVADVIPCWPSFFQQRRPGARAIPPRVVQVRVPADAELRVLARVERRGDVPFAVVRPLGRIPGRVLALAIGDADASGRTVIVAVTPDRVAVLATDATPIAELRAPPQAMPVRDPAAALAIGDFGGGRIAVQRAGEARAEVLALKDGALEPAGALDAAPLCAGGAGRLFGAFSPGTGVFLDVLTPLVDGAARPRSARLLYGAAAAPGGGPIAFAVLGTDLSLALLGPDLAPIPLARATVAPRAPAPGAPPAPAPAPLTGSGFALADVDGDGTAELVASSPSPSPRGPDRLRVLAPRSESPLLFGSTPVDGTILAAAGGDLTGDGTDDVVAAAVVVAQDGATASDLLLLTSDPREAR